MGLSMGQVATDLSALAVNTAMSYGLGSQARRENFQLSERAAENADKRTRALYEDYQSPAALLRQYKEAGLSPSLMFGGSGAGGATPAQGAQGSGAAGISPLFQPIDPMNLAQISLMDAEKRKTDAETENINQDTELKEAETAYKNLENNLKTRENKRDYVAFTITTANLRDTDGTRRSIYEAAKDSNSYAEYMKYLRECAERIDNTETKERYIEAFSNEEGQKILREIYKTANTLENEISILSSSEVSAKFQAKIANCLDQEGFAQQNADAAIRQLKAVAAESELTEKQKNAWNKMLKMLGDHWYTDLIICLGMVFGNFAANSNIKINTGENHIHVETNK